MLVLPTTLSRTQRGRLPWKNSRSLQSKTSNLTSLIKICELPCSKTCRISTSRALPATLRDRFCRQWNSISASRRSPSHPRPVKLRRHPERTATAQYPKSSQPLLDRSRTCLFHDRETPMGKVFLRRQDTDRGKCNAGSQMVRHCIINARPGNLP